MPIGLGCIARESGGLGLSLGKAGDSLSLGMYVVEICSTGRN